jgi:hypothetical protein
MSSGDKKNQAFIPHQIDARYPKEYAEDIDPPRRTTLVRCRHVDAESRVACALHHSLNSEEPLCLLVPIAEEVAKKLEGIILVLEDGSYSLVEFDDHIRE